MQKILPLVLTLVMVMQLGPAAFGTENVASQITAMKPGARIEVRLKDKEKLRGTRGGVSVSGFTLLSQGAVDRQIAFDDVESVRKKSNVKRNVVIAAVVVVGATAIVVITFVALLKTKTIGV